MNVWIFPTSLTIGGVEYEIRTDYRVVLDLLMALNDPELSDSDDKMSSYVKCRVILEIMFPDCDNIPQEHIQEALDKVAEFIDMGIGDDSKKPKTMDWEQDAPIIIPGINKVLNKEIRAEKYMHWWTFLGAYMEIGEGLFSTVVHIRQKKAKGKLEKWENDFYKQNKALVDFKKIEQRSSEEKEALRSYFGFKK